MSMSPGVRHVITSAAVLGLVLGLLEGALLIGFQRGDLLGWRVARVPVWYEILAIAPVVDALLFAFVAVGALAVGALASRIGRPIRADALALAACSVLFWFDLFTVPGRLRTYGVVFLSVGLTAALMRSTRAETGLASRSARRLLPWMAGLAATVIVVILTWPVVARSRSDARLSPAATGSPNVLIVVLDTVRADHTSLEGYARQTTPFLQRLAGDGTVFDRAYSTSSWTLPAHASLLTGKLPRDHGAIRDRLPPGNPMISKVLMDRGYRTRALSANLEWFTRSHGFGPGFSQFSDFFQSPADMAGRTIYGRLFDDYIAPPLGLPPLLQRMTAAEINRSALQWIDANSAGPFFMVLNYFDAHGPYEPPQPFRRQFSASQNPGGLLRDSMLRHPPHLTAEQLQGEIDAYDGGIAYLDRQLETLIGGLRARAALDHTLLIVLADHGESFGEHGLFTHRSALYDELVRVPLLMRWPGVVPAGRRLETPVSIADIAATVLDLLPPGPPSQVPGESLAALWAEPASDSRRSYPVQELARMPFDEFNWVPAFSGAMRAVTTTRWHYIEHERLGAELYDLEHDPGELTNVIATPEGAAVAAELAIYVRTPPSRMARR
jgi:arylsulfatase A-like enzyme